MLALGIGSTEDIFLFWCFSLHSNLSSRGVIFCNIPLERIMPGKFSQLKKRPREHLQIHRPAAGLSPDKASQARPAPEKGRTPSWAGTSPEWAPCLGTTSEVGRWGRALRSQPLRLAASFAVRVWPLLFDPLGKWHVQNDSSNQPLLVNVEAEGLNWQCDGQNEAPPQNLWLSCLACQREVGRCD